jgi:hypothetical protein
LSIENFYKDKNAKGGFKYSCKQCTKEYVLANITKRKETCKTYYKNNKENSKLYYQANKDIIADYKKEYYTSNTDKIVEYKKEHYQLNKDKIKEYQLSNKEITNIQRRINHKQRKLNDALYIIRHNISNLIRVSIKRTGYNKTSKTYDILGCQYDEFISHIENQFLDGMSWDNRSKWHLDHIVPVAFAQTELELYMLNHYTNFRPLWAIDNIIKSDVITEDAINHPIYRKIIELRG